MNRIGILTSGGDAPGMNAAIHAIVTSAKFHGIECIGYQHGYNGLIDDQFSPLSTLQVKHISHKGGTILKSARCERMHEIKFQQQAVNNLDAQNLDGLVVIGGDGSFKGATKLCELTNIPIVGIPGTIDNDIDGSDFTIGFNTATNTALDAIDKIRDTADAFDRIFLVEVMGRHSGHLALEVGVAAEAEYIVCPEMNIPNQQLIDNVSSHISNYLAVNGHSSYIIVIAENTFSEGTEQLAQQLTELSGVEARASILGHMQRGGIASCFDRTLATKMGGFAIESLIAGQTGVMIGEINNQLVLTPFSQTGLGNKKPNQYLLNLYQRKLVL